MTVAHIYLAGHGKWDPGSYFFRVRPNYTINFYTHFAKLLTVERAKLAIRGTLDTSTTTEAGLMCPNLKILNLEDQHSITFQAEYGNFRKDDMSALLPWTFGETHLSDALSDEGMIAKKIAQQEGKGKFKDATEYHIHWIACTSVGLKRGEGEPAPGFNEADLRHRH